ncbi:hypothetical protein D3C72_1822410 [compost metagenome]
MIRLILTPAWLARYSAWITCGSSSAFILAMICAGLPACAWAISRSMALMIMLCSVNGDWYRCFSSPARPRPVICTNRSLTSLTMSSLQVSRPKSVYNRAVRGW